MALEVQKCNKFKILTTLTPPVKSTQPHRQQQTDAWLPEINANQLQGDLGTQSNQNRDSTTTPKREKRVQTESTERAQTSAKVGGIGKSLKKFLEIRKFNHLFLGRRPIPTKKIILKTAKNLISFAEVKKYCEVTQNYWTDTNLSQRSKKATVIKNNCTMYKDGNQQRDTKQPLNVNVGIK